MKKIIMSLFLVGTMSLMAAAQTTPNTRPVHAVHQTQTVPKTETKVKSKPTSTIPQKVNNVVRPKHKKYKGRKTKTKMGQ